MLICKLSDQLGNQMFAYAAIKSIAKDKGYDFYVHDEYDNQFLKNDTDKRLGCNLTTIFENIRKEVIHDIPTGYNEFQEITTTKSPSSFQKEALQVKDNTVMKGHYIFSVICLNTLTQYSHSTANCCFSRKIRNHVA